MVRRIVSEAAGDVLSQQGDRALVNYLEGITDPEILQHVLDSNPKIAEVWETHTYRLAQNEGEGGVKAKLKEEGHDVTTGDEPVVHDPMDIGAQGHDEPEKERASQRVAVRPTEYANTSRMKTAVNPHTGEAEQVAHGGKQYGKTGVTTGGGEGKHKDMRTQGYTRSQQLHGAITTSEEEHSKKERDEQHIMSDTLARIDAERAAGEGGFGVDKTIPEGQARVVMPSRRTKKTELQRADIRDIPQEAYEQAYPPYERGEGYTGVAETTVFGGRPQVETGHKECPECLTGTRSGLRLPKYGQHFGKREHMMGDQSKRWYDIRLPDGRMTENDMFGNEHPDPDDPAQHTEGGFFHIDNHKSWGEHRGKLEHQLKEPMSRRKVEECLSYLGIHPDSADVLQERYPDWDMESYEDAREHGFFYNEDLNRRLGIQHINLESFHPSEKDEAGALKRETPGHIDFKWDPKYSHKRKLAVDDFGEPVEEFKLDDKGEKIPMRGINKDTNEVEDLLDDDGNPRYVTYQLKEKAGVRTRKEEKGGLGSDAEPEIGFHLRFMRDVLLHEKEAKERKANWMEFGGANEPDLGEKLAGGLRVGRTPCSLCAGHGTIQGDELLNYLAGSKNNPRYSALDPNTVEDEEGRVVTNTAYVNEGHADYAADAPLINDELMQNSRPFNQAGWDEDSDPLMQLKKNKSDEYVCIRCAGHGVCSTCPDDSSGDMVGGSGNIPKVDSSGKSVDAMTSDERAEFYRNHALFAHAHRLALATPNDPRFLQSWDDERGIGRPPYFQTEGPDQWRPNSVYVKPPRPSQPNVPQQMPASAGTGIAPAGPVGTMRATGELPPAALTAYGKPTQRSFRELVESGLYPEGSVPVMRPSGLPKDAPTPAGFEGGHAEHASLPLGTMWREPITPAPEDPEAPRTRVVTPGDRLSVFDELDEPKPLGQIVPPGGQIVPPGGQIVPPAAPEGQIVPPANNNLLQPHEEYGWPTATPWEIHGSKAEEGMPLKRKPPSSKDLPGGKREDVERIVLYERDPETNELIIDEEGMPIELKDANGKTRTRDNKTLRDDYVGSFHKDPDHAIGAGYGHGVGYHDPGNAEYHLEQKINELAVEANKKFPQPKNDDLEDTNKDVREQYVMDKMKLLHERETEITNRWHDADLAHNAQKYPNKVWENRDENLIHAAMRKYPELYAGWKEEGKTDDDVHMYPGWQKHGEQALFQAIREIHPNWVPQAGSHNLAPEDLVVKSRARSPIDSAFFILKTYSRSVPRTGWAGGNGTTTASVSVVSQQQPLASVSTFL